jgi:hypothetical protein
MGIKTGLNTINFSLMVQNPCMQVHEQNLIVSKKRGIRTSSTEIGGEFK